MKKKTAFSVGIIAIFSCLIVFIGEVILRQHISEVVKWIIDSPFKFIINGCIIFGFTLTLTSLLNKIGRGVLAVSLIYIGGCVVSFYKFRISGKYLIPADIFLIGEATSISKEMNINLEMHVVLSVVLICILSYMAYKLDFFEFAKKQRFLIVLLGMSILGTTVGISAIAIEQPTEVIEAWKENSINEEYAEEGFLVGFSKEMADLKVTEPENYSKDKVETIIMPYHFTKEEDFIKPNIIMIMSEGFFDISRLEGISLSKNPLLNFEQYRQAYGGGAIMTSVYGGKTCQTEYEVLTGHSVDFTGPDNIAYMRFANENTPSIPKLLKEEGYETVGIHAYEKSFFSRDVAYKDLGIDTFLAEEDFIDPILARGYISDGEVVDQIISEYEDKKDKPLFIHTVTMQNHMPYTDGYRANGISVTGDRLSEESLSMLETYANGVSDSDQALDKLIKYFEKVEEPTVIVMYGDHLPDLGEDYKVYKESGYIKRVLDEKDYFNLYQTPFVVWNNYGLPAKDFGNLDASYLGSTLLDYIGYHKDPYMNFLNEASHTVKAYHEGFYLDSEGKVRKPADLRTNEEEKLKEMWMLQYDRLFQNEN